MEEKVLEWSETQREAQRAIEHAREEYLKQQQKEEAEREEAARQEVLRQEAARKEAQQNTQNTGTMSDHRNVYSPGLFYFRIRGVRGVRKK